MIIPMLNTTNELSNLGTLWTQITSWIGEVVSTITSHPLLMVGLGIFVVGATIGLAQRLIRG